MVDLESIAATEEYLQFSLEDRVKLCMFCYGREDVVNLSDAVFQGMIKNLPEDSPLLLLEWDDIQQEDVQYMLDTLGLKLDEEQLTTTSTESYLELQNLWGKNKSIMMIETIEEAKSLASKMFRIYSTPAYNNLLDKLTFSLKYDGWNITVYYVPGERKPVLIHTRARTGKAIYCTEILRDLMPEMEVTEVTRVIGELCLDEDALVKLRKAYPDSNKKFVNTRNSVSSVVHGTININLIKSEIHYFAFAIQTVSEGNICDNYYDTLEYLKSLGFEVPFCCVIDDMEEFDEAMEVMTNYYKDLEKHIQCDGVVLEPNYFDVQAECTEFTSGNNQTGLVAIKADYWSKKLYESVVVDIIVPRAEQNRSIIAIVEPVRSTSGSMLSRVPLINCRRAQAFGKYVDVGDHILFTYHSQQIIHFEGFADTIKSTSKIAG